LIGYSLAQTYCSPGPTTTVDGNLGRVVFQGDGGTFTDPSDCPGVTGARDLTNYTGNIHPGGTYELSYNVTTCGNMFASVSGAWIDFDKNGSFDVTELLFPFNRTSVGGWVIAKFVVMPTSPIVYGMTRMRVQVQETASPNPLDPCNRFAYGGTKDFSINIQKGGGDDSSSSSSGMSGGTIFIIIVIVAAGVYVIVGCTYNRVKGAGWRESCPNYEFWSDLPGLMKDGFLFTKAKLTGKGGSGDGYDKIDDNL